jgi:hypothetical protein
VKLPAGFQFKKPATKAAVAQIAQQVVHQIIEELDD